MRHSVGWLAATAVIATALAAGGALAAAARNGAAPASSKVVPAPLPSAADIARGKALFTGTCGAYCHRPSAPASLQAVSDAPSLFDCDWLHGGSDAQIFHTITHGVDGTRMVAFGGAIPDADIWRIIAYLRAASQCTTNPRARG